MQIQYPAYTQPPAFTPPTIPQLGWHFYGPDQAQLQPRGRTRLDRVQTANQTTGADVFAVENFAPPGRFIGVEYRLSNPHQFINRREYRARGGGYLNAPWHFWGFDLENLPIPKPLAADTYIPDRPNYRRSRLMTMPWTVTDLTVPAAVVSSTDWMVSWPDSVPRRSASNADMPAWVSDPTTPAEAAPVTDWMTAPDRPARRPLSFAGMPSTTAGQPLDAILLRWSVVVPSSTSRRALATGQLPATFTGQPLDAILLRWSVIAPASTSRRSLVTAQVPSSAFLTLALEQRAPVLQWSVQAPHTTSRRALTTGQLPTSFRPDPVPATQVSWWVVAPTSTTRAALTTAQLPVYFRFPGEVVVTVPDFFKALYPDRTWRAIREAVWMPSDMAGPPPSTGFIRERRYDDQTSRQGSRSVTGRISQI